jgi:hypothetical protein
MEDISDMEEWNMLTGDSVLEEVMDQDGDVIDYTLYMDIYCPDCGNELVGLDCKKRCMLRMADNSMVGMHNN